MTIQDTKSAAAETPSAAAPRSFKRVMRGLDMTLFTVCAILVIDQLPASAAIGAQSIFWWVVTLILFFIPYGLITAELGSTYPEQGGIYRWVKRAYGDRWAGRTAWLWWINVALWMPSVYILFAAIFSQMFFPDLSLWWQIAICLALTWATVWINIIALSAGKWVPNIGAIAKALIMLAIGVGGFYALFAQGGAANDLSFSAMLPSWGASLAFLPVVIYNFMGFELMSGASEEMTDPARDVPRAIILSGVLIASFYLLGTIGILIAIPLEEISLVEGILDTLWKLYGDTGLGGAFVWMLGLAALYTLVANMATWTIGANRSASEAALEGDLPATLGTLHPVHKTPVNAALWTGAVSSAVLIIYGLMAADAEDLFWTIFAFSAVVFLAPYLIMFPAFLTLRRKDAARPRPYRVPGGNGLAAVFTGVCWLFIAQAIVFLIYTPGEFDLAYALSIVVGVLITLAVGELLVSRSRRS